MDNQTDPLVDHDFDRVSLHVLEHNSTRRPSLPVRCTHVVKLEYTAKGKLHPQEVNSLAYSFTGSSYRRNSVGAFDAVYYVNGDIVPFYVFGMDGQLLSVIEPSPDGALGSIADGGIRVHGIRTLDRANSPDLCKLMGITPDDEKQGNNVVRGEVLIKGETFRHHETVKIDQLGIFISKNPKAMSILDEDNSARTLRNWLSDEETLLNTDILYKLVVFVNSNSSITRLYSTADGKLIDRVYIIRTPVVPSGTMYCRINTYRDDFAIATKAVEIPISDLDRDGGVAVDHTLAIGSSPASLRDWCILTQHKLRHVTLAESECDDFSRHHTPSRGLSLERKLTEAKQRIVQLQEEVELLNDTIRNNKKSAHAALNELGKPTTSYMRSVCNHLSDITERRQIPKRHKSWKEKLSNFSDYANAVYRGIDGTYKAVLGVISTITVLGGLYLKYRPRPSSN